MKNVSKDTVSETLQDRHLICITFWTCHNVQNIKNVQTANLGYKHKQSLLPPVFNEYYRESEIH